MGVEHDHRIFLVSVLSNLGKEISEAGLAIAQATLRIAEAERQFKEILDAVGQLAISKESEMLENLPPPVKELVRDVVAAAGPRGLTSGEIVSRVQLVRADVGGKSITSVLSKLKNDGHVIREARRYRLTEAAFPPTDETSRP